MVLVKRTRINACKRNYKIVIKSFCFIAFRTMIYLDFHYIQYTYTLYLFNLKVNGLIVYIFNLCMSLANVSYFYVCICITIKNKNTFR